MGCGKGRIQYLNWAENSLDYRGTGSEIWPLLCTVICTSAITVPFLWCKPGEELIQAFKQQAICYQHHSVAGLFIQLLMEVMDYPLFLHSTDAKNVSGFTLNEETVYLH